MALQAEGVRIIGVAYKDDPGASRGFLQRLGDPFSQVLVDRSGRAGIEFGVSGVPETYLIGADGVILDKHSGPMTAADAERMLARLRAR
jgi:cytochrome c biogenesis protein CcmG/thiol:disulfide interchange protein DsbE